MNDTQRRPARLAGSELGGQRHACAFFHNKDEEYRVLSPFLNEGFEHGDKATCATAISIRIGCWR